MATALERMQREVEQWDNEPPVDPESEEGKHRQLVRDVLPGIVAESKKNTERLPYTAQESYELPQQPGEQRELTEDVPQTFKRGKREATGGYLPKSRVATTMLGVHLPDDVAEDFKLIARLQGKTAAKILGAFVTQYVEAYKSPQQVEAALRGHVENLSGDRKTPLAQALKSLAKPQQ